MVFVKATYRNTVRRFSVPDGIQFDDTRKKLVEIFPELKGTTSDSLALYYRDADRDLVAISSDEELHIAEQLVGEDKTLKLLVGVNVPAEEKEEDEDEIDLLQLILSPFGHHSFSHQPSLFNLFSLGSPSWTDRTRLLKQQEERLRRRREYEEKMRKAHLEQLKEMRERAKKAEEERRKQAAEKESETGGEVKEGSRPVLPTFPCGWSVNPFDSWEPVVYRSPFGSTTCVWGPWGYKAHYGEDKSTKTEKEGEKEKEQGEEGTEEKTKPQEPAIIEEKVEA